MKQKPWSIIVLSLIYFLAPVGNILMNSWRNNVSPARFASVLFQSQNWPHVLVLMVLPVILGLCIFICRKWSYQIYLILMIIPFVYSLLMIKGEFQLQDVLLRLAMFAANILVVAYFVLPQIRKIYFDPRLRWWQSPPRFVTDFTGELFVQNQKLTEGHIKNISVGGFFIETSAELEIEKELEVRFSYGLDQYKVLATPVFHKKSEPVGYGFRIDSKNIGRSGLRKLVTQLKKTGPLVPGRAPDPEDSFEHWVRQAFRSKSAWIPKKN